MFYCEGWNYGEPLAQGKCEQGIYHFQRPAMSSVAHLNTFGLRASLQTWHARYMSDVACDSCLCCKPHKFPFVESSLIALHPLHFIYTDVWGPTKSSYDGCRFYLLIVDSFTKYC